VLCLSASNTKVVSECHVDLKAKSAAQTRTPAPRHLPADHHERSTWRNVAALLADAAAGADAADVSIALRMVLSMEGVECLTEVLPRDVKSLRMILFEY
jgi:hypothetical protein